MKRFFVLILWYCFFTGLFAWASVYGLAELQSRQLEETIKDSKLRSQLHGHLLEKSAETIGRDYSLHLLLAAFAVTGVGSILDLLPGTRRSRQIRIRR